MEHLAVAMEPTGAERELTAQGKVEWVDRFVWGSINLVKSGWITKDGYGVWAATEAGRGALARHHGARRRTATTSTSPAR